LQVRTPTRVLDVRIGVPDGGLDHVESGSEQPGLHVEGVEEVEIETHLVAPPIVDMHRLVTHVEGNERRRARREHATPLVEHRG